MRFYRKFISTALGMAPDQMASDDRLKGIDPEMIELILSEIVDDGTKVGWEDVAGLETVKKNIMEVIVWPMLRPLVLLEFVLIDI